MLRWSSAEAARKKPWSTSTCSSPHSRLHTPGSRPLRWSWQSCLSRYLPYPTPSEEPGSYRSLRCLTSIAPQWNTHVQITTMTKGGKKKRKKKAKEKHKLAQVHYPAISLCLFPRAVLLAPRCAMPVAPGSWAAVWRVLCSRSSPPAHVCGFCPCCPATLSPTQQAARLGPVMFLLADVICFCGLLFTKS